MALTLPSLSDLFSKVKGALARSDGESVIGIDIGTSSIKIVQLAERKGSAVLETYGEIALGPYNEAEVGQASAPPVEKVTEALKDVIKEANITSIVGGVSVPLSASLISLISLPTKDEQDLAAMVPIEARKYIPVPVSEVTLDWFVIPEAEADFLGAAGRKRSPNATDVLLVAIHNSALERFQSIIAGAGITPRFYEIEPFSIARSSYEHGTTPTMVIDFGASGTRVYVIEFGIIDVSHSLNHGGQAITLALAKSKGLTFTEAEKIKRSQGIGQADAGYSTLEYVFSEARRIYRAYEQKEGKAISKVVLVGGGASFKGITDIAARNFDAPVTVGSPFDRVSAPAFIAEVLTEVGPSFCSAVGLALRAIKG